ncbi:MAG: hypothetical protein WC145_07405 [Aliarcobacter sp.]
MLNVINSVESILAIKEGQIKCFVKDEETGEWEPQAIVPTMSAPAESISTFAVSVPSGSAVTLESHLCLRAMLLNHPDNGGRMWIGGDSVTSDIGIPLEPGQTQELTIGDTGAISAIAENDGEKLIVAYLG